MIQLKAYVDSQVLRALGYKLDIYKNGYVSKCGSTIIYFYRKPYCGEVRQLRKGLSANVRHEQNLRELYSEGLIENRE